MVRVGSYTFVFLLLALSVQSQNSMADNVALFWNLYDSVVTGSRILHDVAEGVGAVSKAIKAIDSFLDTSTEAQLSETTPLIDPGAATAGEPLAPPEAESAQEKKVVSAITCDSPTGKRDPSCPAKPSAAATSSSTTAPVATPAASSKEMPKFNGCGALGFHIKETKLPVAKMTDCCGVHDSCYSASCRANKRDCDGRLRTCLFSVCDDKTLDRSMKGNCIAAAKLLFSGTMALSFQQYNEAQQPLNCPGKSK